MAATLGLAQGCASWPTAPYGPAVRPAVAVEPSALHPAVVTEPDLPPPPGWHWVSHSASAILGLQRPALAPPTRYRVVVVPGSGCTGWAPVAAPRFAGLLHAELLLLHKPAADPWAGPAPPCTDAFVQQDALGPWLAAARQFLTDHPWVRQPDPTRPVLLVGWSEGAELVPHLAPLWPELAAVVLLSAPGLDPLALGQAVVRNRPEAQAAWRALAQAVASPGPDTQRLQGRSLRYWRDLWAWPVAQPLLDGPWPLVRVWGGRDELLPPDAYHDFAQRAQHRPHLWCDLYLPDADHSLQQPAGSAWPWVWAQLETWAREAAAPLFARTPSQPPIHPPDWLTTDTCQAAQNHRPGWASP